jgi:hypothetical protein
VSVVFIGNKISSNVIVSAGLANPVGLPLIVSAWANPAVPSATIASPTAKPNSLTVNLILMCSLFHNKKLGSPFADFFLGTPSL